jgi:hypothetical protein
MDVFGYHIGWKELHDFFIPQTFRDFVWLVAGLLAIGAMLFRWTSQSAIPWVSGLADLVRYRTSVGMAKLAARRRILLARTALRLLDSPTVLIWWIGGFICWLIALTMLTVLLAVLAASFPAPQALIGPGFFAVGLTLAFVGNYQETRKLGLGHVGSLDTAAANLRRRITGQSTDDADLAKLADELDRLADYLKKAAPPRTNYE